MPKINEFTQPEALEQIINIKLIPRLYWLQKAC